MRGKAVVAGALTLALAAGIALARPAGAPPPSAKADLTGSPIRAAPDGAGPSHLLWLSARGREDVVAVVDPLYAAVRLYGVRRPAPGAPAPLAPRLRSLGACALPIDFRPWQADLLKDRIVLEAMPRPGPGGHAARIQDLLTTTYEIRRHLVSRGNAAALRQAGAALERADWDPARAIPCGRVLARDARPGAASPVRARRTGDQALALSGAGAAITIRSRPASRLYGVQLLEPAGRLRTVRISEALPSQDGMLRVRQRYLVYAGHRLAGQFAFDALAVRGKLGQKPLAITPSGEILAMGLTGDGRFALLSCGRITAPSGLCGPVPNLTPLPMQTTAAQRTPAGSQDAAEIFGRVRPAATLAWEADAALLPADCRRPEGCAVRGQATPFVPLAGLRLSRGLYRQTGMAYAQAETGVAAARRFTEAATHGGFTRALARAHEGRGGLPGNLADGFSGDLGIDCSALIEMAWSGAAGARRLTTLGLQSAPIAYGCPSRLPGPEHLRAGDAIALNVTGLLEHAVLFAEPVRLDGASEAWLVLEASSGCGGVCWSLYDPSFFNGWGLYRAAARGDHPCPPAPRTASIAAAPIPRDRAAWLKMLEGR